MLKESIKRQLPPKLFGMLKALKRNIINLKFISGGVIFTYLQKQFKKNDVVIFVPSKLTDFKFRGRFFWNEYEKEEAYYIKKHLNPEATVLELGSCLGYISCITNKILRDKTKHVVLEANPALIPWIEKNRAANNCAFSVENCIISNEAFNTFHIHNLIVGGSVKRETAQKLEIPGVTVEDLERKYGFSFNTLILDIEGGELELFRRNKTSMSKFRTIFMEIHPFAGILTVEEARECEEILEQLKFRKKLEDKNLQVWMQ